MKKISLLILMLTFLLIPTCVNANDISWNDFVTEVQKATTRDVEQDLNNFSGLNTLKTQFNNCYAFYVFGNFGFSSDNLVAGADKIYFYFVTDNRVPTSVLFNTDGSAWRLYFRYYNDVFTYDLKTGSITSTFITGSNRVFITYNLTEQMDDLWSSVKFNSKTGLDYFLTTSYLIGWNATAQCNYYENYPNNNTNITIDLEDLFDSDFPWEDGNAGGNSSGDTYYNYDFNEYFQKPWIAIDNVQGLVQNTATIPFKVMSQSGDEYYPFDKLKLDLRVYKVFTDENGKKTQSLFDTYKRYNGDYVDTTGYNSVSQNGKINVYNYDLRNKFDSTFIDTYLNTSGDNFDYAFQLVLYSFWDDELSSTKLFYFNENNNLNSGTIPDNYYDNNWNSGGDFNFENMNFDSILNTAKNFLSSIFGFFSLFPDWLIYLLTFGISVGVILRILGR